jgi:hypothetical protein
MLVLAVPSFRPCASGSLVAGLPKVPKSARPASCSSCHFGVRAQRLLYDTLPLAMWKACTIPSPENQW